jgi:copper homeostasis protein (lipoprotein)
MRLSFKASGYFCCQPEAVRTRRVPCSDSKKANERVFGSLDKLCCLARALSRSVFLLAFLACEEGQAIAHLELPTICREHMVLPRDAAFAPKRQQALRANVPLPTIGALRLESPNDLPPYFDIAYDPASTGANRRDSFWRSILEGGKQFFITHQLYSALRGERASEMEQPSRQASSTAEAAYARSDLLGVLPATFVGSVPGADRPDIRYQLELFPHQAFFLRMTYLTGGNSLSFDNLGSWAVESDRRLLLLWSGRKAPLELTIKDGNTLGKLDGKGREVASSVDYDLRRTRGLQPLEARVAMRGMYRYFADSGRFTECLTGQSWPVSRESDNAALLFAYSKARRHPGDEVLASLFGRVAAGPTMEDAEQQRTLVVERFMGVWPDETCGAQLSTQSLGNTYWRLTRLGAIQLSEGLQQGEPHLILHSESRRVSGSVGCKRLMGRYELKGDALSFDQIVTARTNCPQRMRLEKAFVEALGQVKGWKIDGHRLDLLDAAGRPVACLEARQMK